MLHFALLDCWTLSFGVSKASFSVINFDLILCLALKPSWSNPQLLVGTIFYYLPFTNSELGRIYMCVCVCVFFLSSLCLGPQVKNVGRNLFRPERRTYFPSLDIIYQLIYRVIEKDGRDLKPLYLKKYWTDLHVCVLKCFEKC
jgi:hypothetical protein